MTLIDRCTACAYVYDEVPVAEIAPRLLALGSRFRAAAAGADDRTLRRNPDRATWSALEYTCHVRDVMQVQRERLLLALETENPEFVSMDREGRVSRDRYNAQDPDDVLTELESAARELAETFATLTPGQWDRTGIYNWPERAKRTMAWLGRHTIHEGEHHLRDVERVLKRAQ